jgi:hypothetical protein
MKSWNHETHETHERQRECYELRPAIAFQTRNPLPDQFATQYFEIPDPHFLFVCFVLFVVKNPLLTQAPAYLRQSASSADQSAPLDRVVTAFSPSRRREHRRQPDRKFRRRHPEQAPTQPSYSCDSCDSWLRIFLGLEPPSDLRHLRPSRLCSNLRLRRDKSNANAPRPHLKPTNAPDDRNRRSPTRIVPIRVHQCHPW